MADPIFPTLSVVEKREFEPQRWGLEFALETAVDQAQREFEAQREDLLFTRKSLSDQRDTLLREINRLQTTAAREAGQAARAEAGAEGRAALAGFQEAGRMERAEAAEQGRMERAAFSAAEAMRRAELREAGLARRAVARGGGAGGRGRRISEEVLAQITATATRPGSGGASLAESGQAAEGFTALNRDLEARMAGLTAEQRADATLEYATAVARSLAEKAESTVEDELEALVAGEYGDLPPAVLEDIQSALSAAAPVPSGPLDLTTPDGLPVPRGAARLGDVDPLARMRPPSAPDVDLSYLQALQDRAAALSEQLSDVERRAAALDTDTGPGILARAQEIVRNIWGPQAARARMDLKATRKANELSALAGVSRGMISGLADVPKEDQRLASLAWDKVKEDPIYKTVKTAVRFGNALTSWETLRASLLRQYRDDPEAMERALAYYKMLRANPEP